ncbi:MAG: hypothetical protein QOK14_594 [Frankiaceae bacterium]|nr:hypothetical protein [Frankiaceae bacterium]
MTHPVDPVDPGADTSSSAALGCYRHPDRLTRIRCTRCGRPICSECMIPASVGFQCPDDVREGNKSMRAATPRTLTGARAAARPGAVTIGLIALNVVVYVIQQTQSNFTNRFLLWGQAVQQGESYRLLTAAFLHASITHLLVNMLSLYVVGTQVERLLGTGRYVALYLTAALGGSAASYAFQGPAAAGLGASGAIFGLLGALLVIVRRLRLDPGPLLGMVALNIALPFIVPNIDWRAHVGGLVAGAALTWAFAYAPQQARRWAHPLAVVAVLAVVVVLVQVRTSEQHALIGGSGAVSSQPLGPQGFDNLR